MFCGGVSSLSFGAGARTSPLASCHLFTHPPTPPIPPPRAAAQPQPHVSFDPWFDRGVRSVYFRSSECFLMFSFISIHIRARRWFPCIYFVVQCSLVITCHSRAELNPVLVSDSHTRFITLQTSKHIEKQCNVADRFWCPAGYMRIYQFIYKLSGRASPALTATPA
mgnify:CR=1 FL=1